MSPRTGRPKIDNPKGERIGIRLRPETLEKLEKCATEMDTTKTAVIEHGIDLVEKEIEGQKE